MTFYPLIFKKSLAFALAVVICGCSAPGSKKTAPTAQPPAAQGKDSGQTPADVLEKQQLQSAIEKIAKSKLDYKIQSGDMLQISVYMEKDLDRQARVSGNGSISLPLAGSVKVAGLSVPDAEELLAKKLSVYIVSPQVSVLITEYGNKHIYVLGEVKKPGAIELPAEKNLTVLEAISLAGGFTELAAQSRTKILRQSEGGQSRAIEIDVSDIMKKGDKNADIMLEPNDVVFVPQSFF